MKKHIPVVAVILFVAALLCLSNFIWMQQEARRTQAVEEAERHLQVYSSLPDDVNVDLAKMFYDRFHLRVQITTKADGDLHQSVIHDPSGRNHPDVIIASQAVLQEAARRQMTVPYASEQTESVPYTFKEADGYWVGLWMDPMVFVVDNDYYQKHSLMLYTWNSVLLDPEMRLAFPDLAATDIATDFLCTFVEARGQEEAQKYLKDLQRHVTVYSKSTSLSARRVILGEADIGVTDAVTARQYVRDHIPLHIVYPQDGTSYWLIGAAVTQWNGDEELAALFMDWLLSDEIRSILDKNHIYVYYTSENQPKAPDVKGKELQMFSVQKNYSDDGRKQLGEWWIKTVRFGKEP